MTTVALDGHETLARTVKEYNDKVSESAGALKQLKKALKEEFDCTSKEQLEELLSKTKKLKMKKYKLYLEKRKEFEKKYRKQLDKLNES